jgi:hypothetical protein
MNPSTMKLLAIVQRMVDTTAPVENNHTTPTALGPQLEDPPRAATVLAAQAEAVVALVATMAAAGAHHTVLAEELVAVEIAEAKATRTATPLATHVAATMPATELKRFVIKRLLKQTTATASCLLHSTSRLASPRKFQASRDHQVRSEATPS